MAGAYFPFDYPNAPGYAVNLLASNRLRDLHECLDAIKLSDQVGNLRRKVKVLIIFWSERLEFLSIEMRCMLELHQLHHREANEAVCSLAKFQLAD